MIGVVLTYQYGPTFTFSLNFLFFSFSRNSFGAYGLPFHNSIENLLGPAALEGLQGAKSLK